MTEMEQVLAGKMPSGNVAARMSEPAVSSTVELGDAIVVGDY